MTMSKDIITGMILCLRHAEQIAGAATAGIYQHLKSDGAEDFDKEADDIRMALEALIRAGK